MTTTTFPPGCYVGCTPPRVGTPVSLPTPTTVPPHLVTHAVGTLPFTGADIATLVIAGLALVALGIALARRRRMAQ